MSATFTPAARVLAEKVRVDAVHRWLVHGAQSCRQHSQRVLLRDRNLVMLGAKAPDDFPRILPFVKLLLLKDQRECIRTHAILAKDRNQRAGIDSARKETLRQARRSPDATKQHRAESRATDLQPSYRCLKSSPIAADSRSQRIPVFPAGHRSALHREHVSRWDCPDSFCDRPGFIHGTEREVAQNPRRIGLRGTSPVPKRVRISEAKETSASTGGSTAA